MTVPHESIAQQVLVWMQHAEEDWALANHAIGMTNCPYRLVAYHAQQCAEKYLKAYLVSKTVDFPYTHNISLLRELCLDFGDWPGKLEDVELLSQFAVTLRYPGTDRVVTVQDAKQAIQLADLVRQAVKKQLSQDGIALR